MLTWIILIIALLALIMVLGYPRVNFPRLTSFEGIEDPAAVQAYDRISRWPQFRFMRRMVANELKSYHPKGTLVDIGCGPGYLVAVLAGTFPGLYIIGADISEEMTKVAGQNLSRLGFGEKVEFRQGDVQALPFEDASIDFVVSTLSLHHWSDPRQALPEIYRILKPGGQFLIYDVRRDVRRFGYWIVRFATACVVPAPLRHVNEPLNSILSSYTPAELQDILSGTAFQQWKIKPRLFWAFVWGQKS